MDTMAIMVLDEDAVAQKAPFRWHRSRWLRRVAGVALLYVSWCALLYLSQDVMMFPTHLAGPARSAPADPRASVMTLDIEGEEGQVYAWFLPAPSAVPDRPAPVVVIFHGNGEVIDDRDGFIDGYHALGCSVLLPEYRGYGNADGRPSEKGIVADAVRFYDQLVRRPDVDRSRIVFHGRSLGGGVAVQLAAQRPPAALILQSSFTSAAMMAHSYAVPAFLVKNPFRTDKVLPGLDLPTLIVHGTYDSVVPVEHGRQLSRLARRATYVEFKCDHNDFPGMGNDAAHWNTIAEFLSAAGIVPPAAQ